jgi:hypothetical protein
VADTRLFYLRTGAENLYPFRGLNDTALQALLLNPPRELASNRDDLNKLLSIASDVHDYNNAVLALNTYVPLMLSNLGVGTEKSEDQRREVLNGYLSTMDGQAFDLIRTALSDLIQLLRKYSTH